MIFLLKMGMKKIIQICQASNLTCEEFGYKGKHRHLPDNLKYAPQHIIYDECRICLAYFKPSYDDRFVEFRRGEVNSIRFWDATIHSVLAVVFNYTKNRYTAFDMAEINRKVFTCKKERINSFLFNNLEFEWKEINEPLSI